MNTVRGASKKLGVHMRTVYRLVERRQIKYVRIGRAIRIPDEAIDEYLRSHTKLARI
jgi:excisionase family DNA binding protein